MNPEVAGGIADRISIKEEVMIRRCLVGALCLFLTACASTTKLVSEHESAIRNVSFERNVKIPEKAYYHGPAQTAGAVLFGPLGALVAHATMTNDKLIMDYMKTHEIDIGAIVLEEFERQVKAHPKFLNKQFSSNPDYFDAKFIVEVKMYGLTQKHGYSSEYRPVLGVAARLVSAKDEKLWERYDYITAMNDTAPSYPFDQYFQDPKIMDEAYRAVSKHVVSLLMENL